MNNEQKKRITQKKQQVGETIVPPSKVYEVQGGDSVMEVGLVGNWRISLAIKGFISKLNSISGIKLCNTSTELRSGSNFR